MKNQASTSTNNAKPLNVPKQGYNARNPNGYGYTRNLNAYTMPRNTSYVNGRSSHYANVSRHAYPRNNNAYVSNNVNYHANDHSRDSIITIFPCSDNNHAFCGNSKYMPKRNPYHISNRNQASRNDIIVVNDYPMPRFVCLAAKKDVWYLDNGCLRHMTSNKSLLNNIRKVTAEIVMFGDSSKCDIIGIGDIGNESFKICDVQLVTGLRYNLLSISQLCDNGCKDRKKRMDTNAPFQQSRKFFIAVAGYMHSCENYTIWLDI
ncbi:hypothetical protein POM88_014163 [Heracleum sosnowskyi]|uniref:Retrovirus-related Pol polyprotein from transposon TNT 1-94-like beta-barrel domain-containing protein n=1 Tax=Heracleum sosnowskyi TaxID=360622 RepID=A0AAD8IZW6_9APIA|nr:hypothetical protein POM88_014163 [Heracleum sosnowskyi]